MAVDIEQASTVIGFMNQMIVPDLVVQRGWFRHERKLQKNFYVSDEARKTRWQNETSAQRHYERASPDVAEVANRPKKRPGRRERSSMTIRLTIARAALV